MRNPSGGDYFYPGPSAALYRYYELYHALKSSGSQPMNPDETSKPPRMSGDNATWIENQDLQKIMDGVSRDQWWALYFEYSQQTAPIEGPLYGRNKLEGMRQVCGRGMTSDDYILLVRDGVRAVIVNLERLGWSQPRP